MIWLVIAATLLSLYLGVLLAIAWLHLHPVRIPIFLSPGAMGAPQEDVEFDGPAGKLRGWWVPAENPRAVAVFSHGYLMNRAEMVPIAVMLWKHGVSCLLFDFRAHGRSDGKKSSMGPREADDVIAAATWARNAATPQNRNTDPPGQNSNTSKLQDSPPLILIGSSMGCAANAFALASDPSLAQANVLDSGYSRLSEAIIGWWRFLGGKKLAFLLSPTTIFAIPFAGFSPFQVDVAAALTKAGPIPTLLLHGDADDLAEPSQATRNEAACPGPKRLVWFPKCGHSEARWVLPFLYQEELLSFLFEHEFIDEPQLAGERPLEAE